MEKSHESSDKKESLKKHIVLLVDKDGKISTPLCHQLKNETHILLVSNNFGFGASDDPDLRRISHIPFWTSIPVIPDISYSHIVMVYGKESRNFIAEFVAKAKHDAAILTIIVPLKEFDEKILEPFFGIHLVKILVVGDLFDGKTIFDSSAPVTQFLVQAKQEQRIDIPGTGTAITYPVYMQDFLDEVVKITFHKDVSAGPFLIYPMHAPTQLSLAHMIQKVEPLITIDFMHHESEIEPVRVPIHGIHVFGDAYPLGQRIKHAMEEKESYPVVSEEETSSEEIVTKVKTKRERHLFTPGFFAVFGVILIVFFLLLPLNTTLIFSYFGGLELQKTKESLEGGDIAGAKRQAIFSKALFAVSKNAQAILSSQAAAIGQESTIKPLSETISGLSDVSNAVVYLSDGMLALQQVFSGERGSKKDFVAGINNIKNAATILQNPSIQQSIAYVAPEMAPKMQKISTLLSPLLNTSEVLPTLFGFDKPQQYLLLFQNNMELRPSGGFIGSYGLLTLNKGRITKFSVYNVYDADGQLKGHVEPPYAIRRYLPQIHWYLRDSNYNIDFLKSAQQAAYFLNLETGETVDGIIAVDTIALKNIIAALGEVSVPEYGEKVTVDNFYMLTQSHAEKNNFPGSTQKKDFLQALATAIMLRFENSKDISYVKLAEGFSDSLLQKHVLFAFADSTVQSVFTINNFSSSLFDNRKKGEDVINDFVGVNEANLGVNKANYFVKRSINHGVFISQEGSITGKITVTYANDSEPGKWPGGEYKTYLRAVLPQGAELTSVALDGASQTIIPAVTDAGVYEAPNFKAPAGLEIEKGEELGKTWYGFLITVAPQKSQTVTISYQLPDAIAANAPTFLYDLKVFKQPGTGSDPYTLSLIYPATYRVLSSSEGLKNNKGSLSFTGKLDNDLSLKASFARK